MPAEKAPRAGGHDSRDAIRVGLISDTHGWLDPRAIAAFEREEPLAAVVHAGDIGPNPQILHELGAIAPVTAVMGNCDTWLPGRELDAMASIAIAGVRVLVIHDLADLGPIPQGVEVVVRGHSHVPSVQWHGRVLVVNPGSASERRRQASCTVAMLQIADDRAPSARIIDLDELGKRAR